MVGKESSDHNPHAMQYIVLTPDHLGLVEMDGLVKSLAQIRVFVQVLAQQVNRDHRHSRDFIHLGTMRIMSLIDFRRQIKETPIRL